MRKILSWLSLPAVLLVMWLLLNDSLSAGHIVLGAIISLLLAWAAMPLRPLRSVPKRPLLALRLIGQVALDIVHSSLIVGRFIWLGPNSHTPGFLEIPLSVTDPHAMAALSCIITYTPGTVWAGHSLETNILTLHILDLKEEQHWLDLIQKRYERPLMEIFE